VIDLALRYGIEERLKVCEITVAERAHPQRRRVSRANRGEGLDPVRVLPAEPADDERDLCPGVLYLPDRRRQFRGLVADDELIVGPVPLRKLMPQVPPGGGFAAHDNDGRQGGGASA
jgi:hypothetical protein